MATDIQKGVLDVSDYILTSTTGPNASSFVFNPTTGFAETEVDGQTFVALPVNQDNEPTAQIGHRTGLLADLIGLDGVAGEIAVPTDYKGGVIVYTGVAGEAYYTGTDMYRVDLATVPVDANGQIFIPRGFSAVCLDGQTVHPDTIAMGGAQILASGTGPSPNYGKKISVLVLAPLESLGISAEVLDRIIDYSDAGNAGLQYFEFILPPQGIFGAFSRTSPIFRA